MTMRLLEHRQDARFYELGNLHRVARCGGKACSALVINALMFFSFIPFDRRGAVVQCVARLLNFAAGRLRAMVDPAQDFRDKYSVTSCDTNEYGLQAACRDCATMKR